MKRQNLIPPIVSVTALLLFAAPHVVSCSDSDPASSPDTSRALPDDGVDTARQRLSALEKLMGNATDLVVTGEAYAIGPESASIPLRVNAEREKLPSAHIAIVLSDYPDVALDYNSGNVEFYLNPKSVDADGIATAHMDDLIPCTSYRYRAFYHYNDAETAYGEEMAFTTPEPDVFEAEAVDLGLSVKWASANLGATRPYQSGVFYNYGQVARHEKGYSSVSGDICGTAHDAASAELSDGWAMPTRAQVLELINSCTWKESVEHGYEGYRVFGINARSQYSIFIPFAGHYNAAGVLTSSRKGFMLWTGQQDGDDEREAFCLRLLSAQGSTGQLGAANKTWRLPIRPVRK